MTEVNTAGASAPGELKGALLGFVHELRGFRQDIQDKLNAQEARMSMIERKSALRSRTPLANAANEEAPHQKAFNAYLRNGDDGALRGLPLEEKGLSIASDGGFLAASQVADQVQNVLQASSSVRALATVVQVESPAYEVLVDRDTVVTGWSGEEDMQETGAPGVERISIPLHELSAMPKASQRLLDDAAFDVETWLAGRIAEKFSRAEAAAFLTGNGIGKPRGILDYRTADVPSIESPGGFSTGVDGGFPATNPAEPLIDLVYDLPAHHRANATFLMNSKTVAAIRKLKDADGRFIWTDSLAAGEPARLLGYPVMTAEDMPDMDSGEPAVLFADFAAAYTIVERPELRVLRDPFSAKPHVLFYATKRVGGGLVDGRAVRMLTFVA